MDDIATILHRHGHSLVVAANDGIHTFNNRGVADLYRLLHSDPAVLRGSRVADKVVGKGAAALMVLGGVTEVYADIISTPALALFEANGIPVKYGREVDNIINRQGNGICPVESLCLPCSTPAECLPLITSFLSSLK